MEHQTKGRSAIEHEANDRQQPLNRQTDSKYAADYQADGKSTIDCQINTKLVIAICDDNMTDCEKARTILIQSGFSGDNIDIHLLRPNDMKCDLEEKTFAYHIVIMDIEFKNSDFDGILLAQEINAYAKQCQIIYLSHILSFAPQVYESEHCYFVMKDNMETMLPLAMKKAVRLLKSAQNSKIISFISDSHKTFLPEQDIMYIEKDQRTIKLHTTDRSYTTYNSLTSFSRQLDQDMVRIHNSYIVNLSYIADIRSGVVVLKNNTELPIGRTFQAEIKKAYMNYWARMV